MTRKRRTVSEILHDAGPIATFIRVRRKELGYTQEELAYRAGVNKKVIREIELGRTSSKIQTTNRILNFFGHQLAPVPLPKEEYHVP